mmetsp:Transcript_41416/g.102169  ORF Transcript_41416/g.102169 Transcript_41416/m.102169 type:complete len:211 (-) Transcript_41416:706-1338(-)
MNRRSCNNLERRICVVEAHFSMVIAGSDRGSRTRSRHHGTGSQPTAASLAPAAAAVHQRPARALAGRIRAARRGGVRGTRGCAARTPVPARECGGRAAGWRSRAARRLVGYAADTHHARIAKPRAPRRQVVGARRGGRRGSRACGRLRPCSAGRARPTRVHREAAATRPANHRSALRRRRNRSQPPRWQASRRAARRWSGTERWPCGRAA